MHPTRPTSRVSRNGSTARWQSAVKLTATLHCIVSVCVRSGVNAVESAPHAESEELYIAFFLPSTVAQTNPHSALTRTDGILK